MASLLTTVELTGFRYFSFRDSVLSLFLCPYGLVLFQSGISPLVVTPSRKKEAGVRSETNRKARGASRFSRKSAETRK